MALHSVPALRGVSPLACAAVVAGSLAPWMWALGVPDVILPVLRTALAGLVLWTGASLLTSGLWVLARAGPGADRCSATVRTWARVGSEGSWA